MQTELAPNPVAAPADGVVTRWRIKTGAGKSAQFTLRVLHPLAGGQFLGAGTSTMHVNSSAGGIETFTTRLPIAKGDSVGVDLAGSAMWRRAGLGAGAGEAMFSPPLADGKAAMPGANEPDNGVEYFYNADIEPDADKDGFGDDSQDNCPKVFNPGQENSDGAPDGGDACELPAEGPCANPKAGTAAADTFAGTPFGDRVAGLGGADTLSGGAGDDCLAGGPGKDRLAGNAGNDILTGGPGKDELAGGPGDDRLNSADGVKETVKCGAGFDRATADKADALVGCEKVVRK